MKITGTSYFVDTRAALKYYAPYGCNREVVFHKARRGEIHVGVLPPLKAGQRAVLDREEGRYFIHDSSAVDA
jgi:hypothetical protein